MGRKVSSFCLNRRGVKFTCFSYVLILVPPEFVRKLSFRLRSNFQPWLPPFSNVLLDGLRLLLHFFHKDNHGHSLALYFLHECLKFVKIVNEKNRYIYITYTPSFHLLMGLLDGEFIRFSIYFTKAGTLPSHVASITSNFESKDSKIILLLNFGGNLQQKFESHWACQKYVWWIF